VEAYQEYVTVETLTTRLSFMSPPAEASVVEDGFDGETLKVGLKKA
jgi:hypothetical protein